MPDKACRNCNTRFKLHNRTRILRRCSQQLMLALLQSMCHGACRRSLPTPTDRLWGTKAIQPRLVPNGVPQSYPDTKIPILENPQLFEKLETEALFYAFYYQPGTYQQYLAARELKRQSWRYHKQHRAWFQVHYQSCFRSHIDPMLKQDTEHTA